MRILIVLLLLTTAAFADSVEFESTLFTAHFYKLGADKFENKASDGGRVITNRIVGVSVYERDADDYQMFSGFIGQDSIGSPIQGGLFGGGMYFDRFRVGMFCGVYIFNNRNWSKVYGNAVRPFYLYKNNSWGITPLAGINLDYVFSLDNGIQFGIINRVTPTLTNHAMSIGYKF